MSAPSGTWAAALVLIALMVLIGWIAWLIGGC